MFAVLVREIWALVRLQRTPDTLPGSAVFLHSCLIAYALSNVVLGGLLGGFSPASVLLGASEPLLLWVFVASLLRLVGLLERARQTTAGLCACGTLLNVVGFPLLWLEMSMSPGLGENGAGQWSGLLLLFWWLAVVAHHFRAAMAVPLFTGAGLAVAYTLVVVAYQLALRSWLG